MRESEIEKYLSQRVKETGGLSYKWASPGRRNVPDRIIIYPGNHVFFVECKKPETPMPTKAQVREHLRLHQMQCVVTTVWCKEQIDHLIAQWSHAK